MPHRHSSPSEPPEILADRWVRGLLAQDRHARFAGVAQIAQSYAPDDMDRWEIAFLVASVALDDLDLRRRAIELYAHLKVTQAAHCEPFPGYPGADDPIPSTRAR